MAIIYYDNNTEINLTDLISVIDNLNSSSTTSALSANQGKALNTLIGNLSNLTTANKDSVVSAINDVMQKMNLLGSEPIGSVVPYCGTTAPTGYIVCDGRAISRANYADLYNVIGTTYGSGDGSTTFNVPDLRDKFVLGKGTNTAVGDVGDNMNIISSAEDILTYVVMLFVIKAEGTESATMVESLPVGSVIEFDGNSNDIPTGWVEMGSEVIDEYNNSTTIAYSTHYVNNLYETSTLLLNWTGIGSTSSLSYNLNDDITKYKYLYIMCSKTNSDTSGSVYGSSLILSSLFKGVYSQGKGLNLYNDVGDTGYYTVIQYDSDTSVKSWASSQLSTTYIKILGLN